MSDRAAPYSSADPITLTGGAHPSEEPGVLISAVQSGDLAFSTLYERYLDRIYAYLRARTATDEDAADLTQQVFLQALSALPRYREGKTPFAAWLFRIARNAAIDGRRRARPSTTLDALPLVLLAAGDLSTEAQVLRRERLERLRTLLSALDRDKRELLALRFAAGLTIAETAVVVGKSEAAVKKSLFRLLHALKEQTHDLAD